MAGNFEELDDIVQIMQVLASSDRFTKMLHNKDIDAENTSLPIGIDNIDLIEYSSLYPYMKVIDLSEEGVNTYVNVYYGMSANTAGTKWFKRNSLFIDVYVHQDLWKISTGIRTYKIMQEIDKKINERPIPKITSSFSFKDYRAIPSVNAKYAGFGIVYEKVDIGFGDCNVE